jgi:hypothetical protein
MPSAEVNLVLSTVVDGRAKDLRFRQRQLVSLQQWIVRHTSELEIALNKDSPSHFKNEARFLIARTLLEIKRHYDPLDLKQELKDEYRIMQNRNSVRGYRVEELIYLLPETHTLFFSVLSALAASIAAGSCCLIEVRSP